MNLESIRRQTNHALPTPGQQGHNGPYAEATRMAEKLNGLIEQAQRAMEADDSELALDVLEVITEVLGPTAGPACSHMMSPNSTRRLGRSARASLM